MRRFLICWMGGWLAICGVNGATNTLQSNGNIIWFVATHSEQLHEAILERFAGKVQIVGHKSTVQQQSDGLIIAKSFNCPSFSPVNPWQTTEIAEWAENAMV